MIDLYKRLHCEEQETQRALGREPSQMGPMMGLAIGIGMTVAGLVAITVVLTVIGLLVS